VAIVNCMDPKIKADWVAALRSGKYTQAQGRLRISAGDDESNVDGYCCLGVICDVTQKRWVRQHTYWYALVGSELEPTWYGMLPKGAFGLTDNTIRHLANMNDSGKSFNEIADWIEANL